MLLFYFLLWCAFLFFTGLVKSLMYYFFVKQGLTFYKASKFTCSCGFDIRTKFYLPVERRFFIRLLDTILRKKQRTIVFNVGLYKKIKHIRYLQYIYRLPMRGQRTHTNANTIKRHTFVLKVN